MSEEFALLHIKNRMEELGHGVNYFAPSIRHYTLYGGEKRVVYAYDEYFFLTQCDVEISISSEFGSYDLTDDRMNEQLHEHQGKITITNNATTLKQISFLQVIPKHI